MTRVNQAKQMKTFFYTILLLFLTGLAFAEESATGTEAPSEAPVPESLKSARATMA